MQQAQALQLRNELQLRGAGDRGPADVEAEVAQAAPALVSHQPSRLRHTPLGTLAICQGCACQGWLQQVHQIKQQLHQGQPPTALMCATASATARGCSPVLFKQVPCYLLYSQTMAHAV